MKVRHWEISGILSKLGGAGSKRSPMKMKMGFIDD
jgi:hypothetical protein